MSGFNIKHFDFCSVNCSESSTSSPSHTVTPVDLGEGQVALHCDECGAHVVMTVQSPDANVEANRQELLLRSIVGLKKYGVTTERTDLTLRQWLQHILEELLDAANYVQAVKMQLQRDEQSIQAASEKGAPRMGRHRRAQL